MPCRAMAHLEQVAEHPHRLDGGERLGGVVSNVLGEEQLSIEVEP